MLNLDFVAEPYRDRLRRYVEKLMKLEEVRGVLVFGSAASGKTKRFPGSDIDLLIVAENLPENSAERRLKLLHLKEGDSIYEDIWLTPRELMGAVKGGWGVT